MMKISISPEAADYLNAKGGEITIFPGGLTGFFIGNVPKPMVEIGHPRGSLRNYQVIYEKGIRVFIDRYFDSNDEAAEIVLEKDLWWNSIACRYSHYGNGTLDGDVE